MGASIALVDGVNQKFQDHSLIAEVVCLRPFRDVMVLSESEEMVKLSVTGNGIGIPPENMTRIFNHGFTTHQERHGFGLHGGALAAKELGGKLSAFSQGAGLGATFTLELPAKR